MRTRAMASLRRPVAAPGAVTACRRGARSTVSVVYDAASSCASTSASTSASPSASPSASTSRSTTGSGGVSVTDLLVALLRDLRDVVGRGLLRLVRVVRSGIDLELGQLRTAEGALGEHALDRLLDHPFGARL